jgi:HEPN domain-containing protein
VTPKFIPPRPYAPSEEDTGAVFEGAVQYLNAANILYEAITTERRAVIYPMYFLYHHAVELALKACLLAGGLRYPIDSTGHKITFLYGLGRDNGLLRDNETHDMQQLVSQLEAGNFRHRYRYAEHPHRYGMPDFRWVYNAIGELFAQVQSRVSVWAEANVGKRTLPKSLLMVGKMTFSKNPTPPTKPGP